MSDFIKQLQLILTFKPQIVVEECNTAKEIIIALKFQRK